MLSMICVLSGLQLASSERFERLGLEDQGAFLLQNDSFDRGNTN